MRSFEHDAKKRKRLDACFAAFSSADTLPDLCVKMDRVQLALLLGARRRLCILVLVGLRARSFVFFAAGALGVFVGTRAFFAVFITIGKESRNGENGHGGKSEEEFLHGIFGVLFMLSAFDG
jgi:hypothetical protein